MSSQKNASFALKSTLILSLLVFYNLYVDYIIEAGIAVMLLWFGADFLNKCGEDKPPLKQSILNKDNWRASAKYGLSAICGSAGLGFLLFYILSYVHPEYLLKMDLESVEYSLYYIALVVLAVPVGEELIFRKIVLSTLHLKFGFFYSALISSILFGLAHDNLLGAFYFGMALCYLVKLTKSLFFTILIHCSNNAFVSILDYLFDDPSLTNEEKILELQEPWVALLIGILIFIGIPSYKWVWNNIKDDFRQKF